MNERQEVAASSPKDGNLPTRMFRWLDKRTGVHELMEESLNEPIPGGARLAYVFGSGLLYIFISQIITGICLAIYYVPSAETAHTSVAYITKQVAAGAFLRSLHYYGSSAMIIVLALHFLQTFLYGSFKGRRELLWISGAVLSFLVLGMGFTGYLLPWDQKAYFATAVGTNIVGQIPLIGSWMTRLVRGGDTIGTLTLSRFYVAHVFLLPAALFMFVGAHIVLFRKAGPAGPIHEDPLTPKLAPEGFYPRQVLMDMTFALLIMVGLGVLSFFHPASLGPIANPADTQFLPRPEWYYLSMFEWLKYWEGPKVVFAVVVIPGLLAALFFLLPFLDRSLERRPWRRPIPVLAVAFVVLGMVYLGARSHMDDRRDPSVARQLTLQDQQEKAYGEAPFEPYVESPGGAAPLTLVSGPVNARVAQGRGIFEAHGCSGCHGEGGVGNAIAPALVGITSKYPDGPLAALLRKPNAKMMAGNMPAVDLSADDMSALIAYLGVLGSAGANVPAAYSVASLPEAGGKERAVRPNGGAEAGKLLQVGAPAESLSAVEGHQLYQQRGCFACHGEAGIGGLAPAIAPMIAGVANAQLTTLLQGPNAKMKAGGMQPWSGSPVQLSSLVVYLRTLTVPGVKKSASAADVASLRSLSPLETRADEQQLSAGRHAAPPGIAESSSPPLVPTAAALPADPKLAAGRAIFVAQGCAACHGSGAQGTRFAPSLLAVTTKFPGDTLPSLLHHPTAKMRDGGMPAVTVNETQMGQLVGYLSSLGATSAPVQEIAKLSASATASAPPQHTSAAPGIVPAVLTAPAPPIVLSALALRGQHTFQHYSCESCHGTGGQKGTVAAPGLAGTASVLPAAILENLLRHHSTAMQNGGMPLTNMSAQDLRSLVSYIRSMPDGPAN